MSDALLVDCSRQCGDEGHSCRLHYFAICHDLNVKILERRGTLSAFAYSREEVQRLKEKREFMEGLGVTCIDEINCRKREKVEQRESDSRRREKEFADSMAEELARS